MAVWKGYLMQQVVDTKLTPKNRIIVINVIVYYSVIV